MNKPREEKKTKIIRWTIDLPMEFPIEWSDDQIEFHLNESSWCCGNIIPILEKYADEHDGCICSLCNVDAVILQKQNFEEG